MLIALGKLLGYYEGLTQPQILIQLSLVRTNQPFVRRMYYYIPQGGVVMGTLLFLILLVD